MACLRYNRGSTVRLVALGEFKGELAMHNLQPGSYFVLQVVSQIFRNKHRSNRH